MEEYSYITVLNNKKYLPGIKALSKCLKNVKSKYPLNVLIPITLKDELAPSIKQMDIGTIYADDISVESLETQNYYWNGTFFKLRAAGVIQFKKIVLLDSDMLIIKNIDYLFEKTHYSACAAGQYINRGWNRLNSGCMVLQTSKELENELIYNIINTFESRRKDGLLCGDQDVFNYIRMDWCNNSELHLSEAYNAFWSDIPVLCKELFTGGMRDIYIVHFAGPIKPWEYSIVRLMKCFIKDIQVKDFTRYKLLKLYRRLCR